MRITVNHLTRMKSPYVCVAGVDQSRRSIRPVLASERLPRSLLVSQGGPFRLGSVVEIGDPQPKPVVPEVEDVVFNPGRTRVVQHLDADEFRDLLNDAAEDSLRSIFGPAIVRKSETAAAVLEHTGTASLGVLRTGVPPVGRTPRQWAMSRSEGSPIGRRAEETTYETQVLG